ncbi:DsbA family oxidoreductase [Lysobacter sp. S4-A87]|uniref:DsbA family oxidoreductase n=1 Tax=Lysobacter sp. S4-A87 TaxID=2925843 RepID=UPI001F539B02|nr:DsbA family oxidoreductase [Lysobacter sp. S4-A87]UNK49705.1 DsbA family oxidoreductase [Lysobacter sp. S4-A87]
MSTGDKLTIDIHFDLICPWCFIGKHQFTMARGKFIGLFPATVVETVWHPVQLLPDVPEPGLPFAGFYERRLGSAEAVRQRQKQVAQAASSVGLDLDLSAIERMPNTARAHHLLRRVATLGELALYEALLDRLFAAYFQRGEDIGDAATLRMLAAEVGVPSQVVDVAQADAGSVPATSAVEGVPNFVFNGRLSLSGARDAAILLMAMSKSVQVLAGNSGAGS